jgi:hypothetical protein
VGPQTLDPPRYLNSGTKNAHEHFLSLLKIASGLGSYQPGSGKTSTSGTCGLRPAQKIKNFEQFEPSGGGVDLHFFQHSPAALFDRIGQRPMLASSLKAFLTALQMLGQCKRLD